ncbi:MAG: efflux transporter outer membrane subunit [Paraburkholderia sp.]|jgi:multidrug efflux system outer membrane protein
MKRRLLGSMLCIISLCSCTLEPGYNRPPLPVASDWSGAAGVERGALSSGTGAGSAATPPAPFAADVDWRTFFEDPALQKLIGLALDNNRDMRVAALKVAEYEAQYRIARSALLPTVDAMGEVDNYREIGITTKESSVTLGETSWELDFFGRLRSLKHQALEQYLATDASRVSTRISLIATVATDYFQWLSDQSLLEVATQTAEADRQTYQVNLQSEQIGNASMQDVRQAESEYASVRSSLIADQRAVAQDLNNLVAVIGCPIPDGLLSSGALEAVQLPAVSAGVPSDLLTRRPDIVEAEHTLKAANANVGAARAAFFPSIQLTTAAGTSSPALSGLFKAATGAWTFAPTVTMPIFDYGNNRATLDVAKIETQIDVASYEKAIQTAFKEVANALAGRATYVDQVESDREYVSASTHYDELAQARYRAGTDSFLVLLDAERTLYTARQQLINDRFAELSNLITLYKALGGGWKV